MNFYKRIIPETPKGAFWLSAVVCILGCMFLILVLSPLMDVGYTFGKSHDGYIQLAENLGQGNGYVFEDYDQPGLESALGRAIGCYFNHPDHFRDLIQNAMRSDYSWKVPGGDYLNIYDYIRHK